MTKDVFNARRIYWAAPFFNQVESDVCSRVEALSDALDHIVLFSPRRDGGNGDRQGDVKSNAKQIYNTNLKEMMFAEEFICWLDRPQMAGHGIMLCEQLNPLGVAAGNPPVWDVKRGPLEQPDIGTVWELGFVVGLNQYLDRQIQIIGFTEKTPDEWAKRKGNVMIGQALHGMVCGWKQLADYLAAANTEAALDVVNREGHDPMGGEVE